MNIAIVSGEISGDLIGGALARELRKLIPDVHLWGVGSESMREAGVELVEDSTAWGAIGFSQAVAKIPDLLFRVTPKLKALARSRRPDAVILIDFGALNVRAARFCNSIGLKVIYYIPPGTWRRSGTNGQELVQTTRLIVVPFSWAEARFRAMGANVVNVGHPMLERVHSEMSRAEFAGHFGMDPEKPIVGLLPGSRRHEVALLMPTLIDTARKIQSKIKDAQFVVGVAPSISLDMMRGYLTDHADLRDRLADLWHEFAQEAESKVWKPVKQTANALAPPSERKLVTVGGVLVSEDAFKDRLEKQRKESSRSPGLPPIVLAKGLTYEVMAHSSVLLTCSGTATLEAALFETPMIVLYKITPLMELEWRLFHYKRVVNIGLPNVLADRRIVPELLQHEANPDAISEQAITLMNDLEVRHTVKSELRAVRAMLGEPGASEKTARLVLDVIASGQ